MYFLKILADLQKNKIAYAIVGGYAVALHGAVRGTIDLDLILHLDKDELTKAESVFIKHGFQSKLPISAKEIFQFRKEYIEKRNLIAWSFVNPSIPTQVIDVIITHDLKKMKTVSKKIGAQTLRVLSIEDLIQMKKDSCRPQDLEDIKALKELLK